MKNPRSVIPLLLVGLVGLAIFAFQLLQPREPAATDPLNQEPPPPATPRLSALASPPDWSELDPWQETITRREFIEMMNEVFTVSPVWRDWFLVTDQQVTVRTGGEPYELNFAPSSDKHPDRPRYWRPAEELPPAPGQRPLEGLKVAIDAGHLGGRWAKIEERWFQVGGSKPVREGNMTLQVAKRLKPQLEKLGAKVSLIRSETEPVTGFRPESLMDETSESGTSRKLAERLFYRTAEIRARADHVNRSLKPDLVLCLHFNAEGWGDDPELPTLVPDNHLHLIVNGAYMDSELELEDQRFAILRKIVARIHPEEAALAHSVAQAFVESSGLPPYQYEPNSLRAVNIDDNPYLWARNLLANRLYDCPVVYLEPYVMNSIEDHARIQGGDYEGLHEIGGKLRPSIFREYADSVAKGLEDYYRTRRPR